jgi:hypothetical protein
MSEFKFDETIICPEDPTATPQRIAQYKEYYKVKYNICKKQSPKTIAEIGVRAGYSAWTFLQACPEAKYIGLDANNGTHGGQGGTDGKFSRWTSRILNDYDFELIDIDTQTVNKLNLSGIDLFHVDGDHSFNGVIHDLDLALSCISDTGIILVDDITYIDTVKIGVDTWLHNNKEVVKGEFVESLRGEMLIRKM